MKKISIVALVVVLAVVATAFAACVDKPQSQELTKLEIPDLGNDKMAVVIKVAENDFTVITVTLGSRGTSAQNGDQLIRYLVDNDVLEVLWQDSTYGKYLIAVGRIAADETKGEYISIYTSVTADAGGYDPVYTVGDVNLYYSQVGISTMKVEAGCVFMFEVQSF